MILLLAACGQQGDGNGESASGYETMTVKRSDITLEQTYPASIEGRQSIRIIPRVDGYLSEIRIKEGQRVRKGQVLFAIDQATFRAEEKAAKANVEVARAGVESAQLTYDSRKQIVLYRAHQPVGHSRSDRHGRIRSGRDCRRALFGHGVSGIESIAVDKIKKRPNRDARAIDNEIVDYVSMVYFAFPWLATAACLAASSSGSAR